MGFMYQLWFDDGGECCVRFGRMTLINPNVMYLRLILNASFKGQLLLLSTRFTVLSRGGNYGTI
ncbi:hypothetical protein Leryth_025522 [Lithospermum erythrorhizon]|nr:hypothetical protein Leryth_025522 [Lithospermum erythrorhizon]